MRCIVLLIFAGMAAALLSGQQIEARLSAEPPLSPAEISQAEAKLLANPSDKDTRLRLLRHYMTFAPSRAGTPSPFQSLRLGHVLYLIENFPSDPVSASALTYVPSESGPFASAGDHAMVRNAWMRAADGSPGDTNVVLNAAGFLRREHPGEAEQLLSRAVDRNPSDRKIAANLGFLYALDFLGMDSPQGMPGPSQDRSEAERSRLREHARDELDRSRNIFVLAAAGTALPNLFVHTPHAPDPNGDRVVFETASSLMSRARQLGPQEPELRGPMPLIREFEEFQKAEVPDVQRETLPRIVKTPVEPSAAASGAIRIPGNIQAAKLIRKPEAVYPPQAMEARIQGTVRFLIVIGTDGRVENATLESGHPLLVPAAIEAARQYVYQPTLLNGAPVTVISQVDIPFTLSK